MRFTITGEAVTVVDGSVTRTVYASEPNYSLLASALLGRQYEEARKLLDPANALEKWARGAFKAEGKRVTYAGKPLPDTMVQRMRDMAVAAKSPEPLFKFWERLQKNPSYRSVEQLWRFLENKNIPITDDGCFLAYKGVRGDYTDSHTGKFDNAPGAKNSMPRNRVSDDSDVECHEGFHVGALEYAQMFASQHSGGSGRIVVCKVDPENVVSVPKDHNSQKMRVCEYEVVGNYGAPLSSDVHDADDYEDYYAGEQGDSDELPTGVSVEEEEIDEDTTVVKMKSVGSTDLRDVVGGGKQPAKKKASPWTRFDRMTTKQLLEQPLDTLRKYAAAHLKITGASKILGGKVGLVDVILDVRRK